MTGGDVYVECIEVGPTRAVYSAEDLSKNNVVSLVITRCLCDLASRPCCVGKGHVKTV